MRKLILLFIVTIHTACASGPYPVTSPYYQIPTGSRLILKQTLTIPPNNARVYIQYGKVVSSREKDQHYSHCWFLSSKVLETAQIITPTTFTVTKTQKYEDYVQSKGSNLIASRQITFGMAQGGSLTAIEYTTELTITSDSQPDIFKFSCSHWEDPIDANHLTVQEIQETLGDIVQLQLATGS